MAAVSFAPTDGCQSLVLSDTAEDASSSAGKLPLDPPSPTSVFEIDEAFHVEATFHSKHEIGSLFQRDCADPSVVESCHYRLPQLEFTDVPSPGDQPPSGLGQDGETSISATTGDGAVQPTFVQVKTANTLAPGYHRVVPGASRAGFTARSGESSVSASVAPTNGEPSPHWNNQSTSTALIRGNTYTSLGWAESVTFGDLEGESCMVGVASPIHSKVTFQVPGMTPGEQHARNCDGASMVATSCAEKHDAWESAMTKDDSDRRSCCDATHISGVSPRGSSCHVQFEHHSPVPARVPVQSACSLSTAASWHGEPPHVPDLPPPPGSSIGASSCSEAVGVSDSWTRLRMNEEVRGDASAVGEACLSPHQELGSVRLASGAQVSWDLSSEVPGWEGRGHLASLVDHASVVADMVSPVARSLANHLNAVGLDASPVAYRAAGADDEALARTHLFHHVGQAGNTRGSHVGSEAAPSSVSHVESDDAQSQPSGPTSRNVSVVSPTWLADDVRLVPGTSAAESEQDESAAHPPSIYLDGVLVYNTAPAHRYSMDDATRISGPTQAHWESGFAEQQGAPSPVLQTLADSSFGTPNDPVSVHAVGIQAVRPHVLEFASTVATGADRQSNVASTIATDGHVQLPIADFDLEGGLAEASELGSSAVIRTLDITVSDLQASVTAGLVM